MSKTKIMLLLLCLFATQLNAQIITTVAGNGICGYSGDFLLATAAKIATPVDVVKDAAGNLYFAEKFNHVIRKVSSAGIITTYAGTGTSGYSGDGGQATAANIQTPHGIYIDKFGNMYIAGGGARVRKIDPSGTISTFAGNGTTVVSGDGGPATAAGVGAISAICADTAGNILLAGNYCIRKVDGSGIISTIAGTGTIGFGGDGGPATTAQFSFIDEMVSDKDNNLFLTDGGNERIRKISGNGIMTTIAGNGIQGYAGDGGPATAAQLRTPHGVDVDSCGNVYISDYTNQVIRIVNTSGNIYRLAGNSTAGFSGDNGPATAAQMDRPVNIFLDKEHNLFFSDQNNCRIRKIALPRCDSLVFPAEVGDVATNEPGLTVWPNPATNELQLQLNTTGTTGHVAIVTLTSRTVQELLLPAGKPATVLLHLPAGMYLVVAETEQGRIVKKLVVE
ncbi:MAG: T9SS type A sorting domain-containing protein [Chitinophagaceae bacterium]|nr:T9SS type A sorting domain-containing protein [Chitinophagaceae bacterium]